MAMLLWLSDREGGSPSICLLWIGIVLVAVVCYVLGPAMFGIDFSAGVPEWASPPGTR